MSDVAKGLRVRVERVLLDNEGNERVVDTVSEVTSTTELEADDMSPECYAETLSNPIADVIDHVMSLDPHICPALFMRKLTTEVIRECEGNRLLSLVYNALGEEKEAEESGPSITFSNDDELTFGSHASLCRSDFTPEELMRIEAYAAANGVEVPMED